MNCVQCGREFEAKRSSARFCSGACVKKSQRGDTPKVIKTVSEAEVISEAIKTEKSKPVAEKISECKLKPVMNMMKEPPEPRLHSGWYWRTDLHRKEVIGAMTGGHVGGEVTKHVEYGNVITRTLEDARSYEGEYIGGGCWVAKFKGEWLTHAQAIAAGFDIENDRERKPLMA